MKEMQPPSIKSLATIGVLHVRLNKLQPTDDTLIIL